MRVARLQHKPIEIISLRVWDEADTRRRLSRSLNLACLQMIMNYLANHKKSLAYLLIGQIGWFACVLSAARGFSGVGIAVVALFLIWHISRAHRPGEELKLIVVVALIGASWESALLSAGLISYPHDSWFVHLAPYWIIALWALFAAQLNVTYGWLKKRLKLAVLFGAVAGPLSFRAGASLHAVRFDDGWLTVAALATGWACLLPIVVMLARRWDGIDADPQPMTPDATLILPAGRSSSWRT